MNINLTKVNKFRYFVAEMYVNTDLILPFKVDCGDCSVLSG